MKRFVEHFMLTCCVLVLQQSWGAMGEGESDEFKRVLLEGNPIFLALTCAVSLMHSVFDFFAFKNDIGFWKNKKSVEGLSVRTIAINCFCQVSQCFGQVSQCFGQASQCFGRASHCFGQLSQCCCQVPSAYHREPQCLLYTQMCPQQ